MEIDTPESTARAARRMRRRRLAVGLNVGVALALALALTVLVNLLAARYYARWDLSRQRFYALSPATAHLLADVTGTLRVRAFLQSGYHHYDDVRALFKEFAYAADRNPNLALDIAMVDPDRDLAAVRDLAREYDIDAPNVVVFECEGRRKYVPADQIARYEPRIEDGAVRRVLTGFMGEQAFASAIRAITEPQPPVVYFLTGHGERALDDYDAIRGYSGLARRLGRENLELRPLMLAESGGIPADGALLVIAGPTRALARLETEIVAAYLEGHGRVLALIEADTNPALDAVLERWSIRLEDATATGLTLSGRELVVRDYGPHPITQPLHGMITMFFKPRVVRPVSDRPTDGAHQADQPMVTVLARTTAEGWGETDPLQRPPRYDDGADLPGPVSIAVASEKGRLSDVDVELKPTRLVVFGDASFVANGALEHGVGANMDLFISAVNWLIDRDTMAAIAPRLPGRLETGLTRPRIRLVFLLTSVALPGLVAFAGLAVWWRRRV